MRSGTAPGASERLPGRHLALICAPFCALVLFAVAIAVVLPAAGCDPHRREVVLTADGEWLDPPELWRGRLPVAGQLDPAYYENRDRSRRLGVCP